MVIGIVGLGLSSIQGYLSLRRAYSLQQQLMPRLLAGDERQKFTSILLGDPGRTTVIVSALLDHEAGDFANSFVQPFKDGKWTVEPRVTNWIRPQDGVTIGTIDDTPLPGQATLVAALTAAAIKHRLKQITGDDAQAISPRFTAGTLYLFICAKPRGQTN
jgi:hypothetical protein